MAINEKLMTADELLALPDDGMQHELVRGVLVTMAPPFDEHGRLADRIGRSLDRYIDVHDLGEVRRAEVGYLLTSDPDTVRAPDVAFVTHEHRESLGSYHGYFPGSPDLVVEVISPNDRYGDVADKVAEWLEHGARIVFVVNPRRQVVVVHRPGQRPETLGVDDTLSGEDVVPGWSMPVRDLFDQS
ncbi:MAG: Uma2 family endonuclease [Chloroflexota bacterium]